MLKFSTVIFFLIAALNGGMAKECKKEDLSHCLSSLQHSVVHHFQHLDVIVKDKYCQDIDKGKECMDQALENCENKYPKIEQLISSFLAYLNQLCSDSGKVYMDIAPCLVERASKFDQCKADITEHDDPIKEICEKTGALKCVATVSKKVCDNGEKFGQALEKQVDLLNDKICVSASISVHNCWVLTVVLLALLLIRNKF